MLPGGITSRALVQYLLSAWLYYRGIQTKGFVLPLTITIYYCLAPNRSCQIMEFRSQENEMVVTKMVHD